MNRYLVLTTRMPTFQESAITLHYEFLARLREQGQLELAGPFTDKSGGAYVLKVSSFAEAKALAESDPVCTTASSLVTVYEWNAS
ncbi:YciI family protein [Caballeronia sp. 15711]|uniref:YciI family protein n=1 Tax=Caballeronia sp. 15711 TaxID=3391029 RepID=UPI0039E29049